MNVRELIAKLSTCDFDAQVTLSGSKGFFVLCNIEEVEDQTKKVIAAKFETPFKNTSCEN